MRKPGGCNKQWLIVGMQSGFKLPISLVLALDNKPHPAFGCQGRKNRVRLA